MPTGDLTNNLRKLQKEVKLIKYNEDLDLANMSLGKPTAFLPLYHYAFTSYSHALAELISASDAELYGKTDFRFIEAMYKILRDLFSYKPLITKEQFFNAGFAERKIIMCSEVLHMVREKSRVLNPPKKSATGGAAVSGLVQLGTAKVNRPKSVEPLSNEASTSTCVTAKRPKTATHTKQVRVASPCEVTSAPQVVNELLQPHKPQGHPIRHMTSHVADYRQHPPLPTEVASPPHLTKERLMTKVPIQASSEVHFMPVTSSVTRNRSSLVKTVSTERPEEEEDEEESEEDEIETVNAVTRGESFLEPQFGTNSPASQPYVQSEESLQYNRTIQAVVDRMNSLDTVVKNIAGLVESQVSVSSDDKVNATLTTIQQQLETLMARMVLVENRVALVEARLSGSQAVASEPSKGLKDIGHGKPEASRGAAQTWGSGEMYRITTHNQNGSESHQNVPKAPNVLSSLGAGDGLDKQSSDVVEIHSGRSISASVTPKEAQPADHQMQLLTANHSNGSSVFSDLLGYPRPNLTSSDINDSAAVGLSPIRKPTDLSVNHSVTLPPFDLTNDDTFAAVTQDEKRLSSTPTKHPVMLESLGDSLSFHFGDTTSQERMLRIKAMIKETEHMLIKPTSTLTGENS
ncbi:uncharacterized protein LOC117329295 [Pecten maximus]|uniref:uncharacterized protein LOC117329295 n=1 Tax=Pecten maximus TaxID=6579 RepID=UPI001458053E|nr:uncharacterized protein LOC117329295 [Pecten maximus]XP_033743067.1 uncharacterized protein LOC117329295 [Pecten maximus]